jgi:hypothetical protein
MKQPCGDHTRADDAVRKYPRSTAAASAALGSSAQLNRLFDRYFASERIAQIAAGRAS